MVTFLKKFKVSNYRGFKNPIEWNLGSYRDYDFNRNAVVDGIVKNGLIYGPNGSGKTSFSLAIFDIVHHLSQKTKASDYFDNYVYAGAMDKPVEFEYTLKLENKELKYTYAKRRDGWLLYENIVIDGNSVIVRSEDNHIEVNGDEFPNVNVDLLNGNANNVSVVNYLLAATPLPKDHYLIELQRFVDGMLWFHGREIKSYIGLDTGVTNLNRYINTDGRIKDFQDYLSRLSGQKFHLVGDPNNESIFYASIDDALVPFDTIASTGTEELKLLYYWSKRMKDATFVFIDEFDAFYHYRLSLNICRMLFGLDNQLFLSTHNTALMTNELLRPDCYFVIGDGVIKAVCDATKKDLSDNYNLERLYRGGTFKI